MKVYLVQTISDRKIFTFGVYKTRERAENRRTIVLRAALNYNKEIEDRGREAISTIRDWAKSQYPGVISTEAERIRCNHLNVIMGELGIKLDPFLYFRDEEGLEKLNRVFRGYCQTHSVEMPAFPAPFPWNRDYPKVSESEINIEVQNLKP